MAKAIKIMVKILTILLLFLGSVVAVQNCFKVCVTAANLMVLNDNIQYYNESSWKTDSWTDEVKGYMQERQENYYESEDLVVRTYSNLGTATKIAVMIIAILMPLAIAFMWFFNIVEAYYWHKHCKARKKHGASN